jgi:hypothetical protein
MRVAWTRKTIEKVAAFALREKREKQLLSFESTSRNTAFTSYIENIIKFLVLMVYGIQKIRAPAAGRFGRKDRKASRSSERCFSAAVPYGEAASPSIQRGRQRGCRRGLGVLGAAAAM